MWIRWYSTSVSDLRSDDLPRLGAGTMRPVVYGLWREILHQFYDPYPRVEHYEHYEHYEPVLDQQPISRDSHSEAGMFEEHVAVPMLLEPDTPDDPDDPADPEGSSPLQRAGRDA